jgi:hypothetical protein
MWKPDPGPCPVDDVPHTACTAPAESLSSRLQADQTVTIPVVRPLGLREPVPAPAAAPEQEVVATFSTADYKRDVHGKAIRERKRR